MRLQILASKNLNAVTEFEKVGWAKALELATTSSYRLSESGSREYNWRKRE